MSKRPEFLGLFRFLNKLNFLISGFVLDFWPYLGKEKSYWRSAVDVFKDDKTAFLERGSVATCGLKTERNIPSIICCRGPDIHM